MSARKQKGFTLIELLIVISIIAILSVIGMAIYGSVQGNARDAKRRSDMDAIAIALEQRYNPYTHTFPAVEDGWFQSGKPKDPNGSDYTVPSGEVSLYVICAQLENKNGNTDSNGNNASGSNATKYCRKNLQAF